MNRAVYLAILAGALVMGARCSAQSVAQSDESQSGVVLVRLSQPVYPPIARAAHISGDIEVMVHVNQDGKVESTDVISGPRLLQRAALDSTGQSQFECRKCADGITRYRMVYTFQLVDPATPCAVSNDAQPYLRVLQSENHVTLVAESVSTCDPAAEIRGVRVRSVKCLYLWKCGVRYLP